MPRRQLRIRPQFLRIVLALCLAAALCAPALAKSPAGAKLVTPEQIMAGLPKMPITVGFDVDDTLLFSSPGWHYAATNTDGPGGSNKYGRDYYNNPMFWQDMNSRWDEFSLPKLMTGECLQKHFARGDKIFIITARRPSPDEKLTALLERVFKVKLAGPVIFTDDPDKSVEIKELKIKIFYGDGDNDMNSARKAGARPIRVLRALNSTAPKAQHPGRLGEEILADSQR